MSAVSAPVKPIRLSLSDPRFATMLVGFAILVAIPPLGHGIGDTFLTSFVAKMMIFAIAAASLDLILGYGGMVSFGHAAYLGLGGYAVGVSFKYWDDICGTLDNPAACAVDFLASGWFQLPMAIVGSAIVALIIGAICLRTSGLYFIMITLAFTQMLFFLGISLEPFGGDDGMNLDPSNFDIGWLGLKANFKTNILASADDSPDGVLLYYITFAILIVCLILLRRIVNSRFGMVVRGSYSNPQRMQAIGFPTYRYRLTAFMISGSMCGVAGFLFANHQEFLTPEYMNWFRSGEIMIMVIMGGMGTVFGPVFGAIAFLSLEEILADDALLGKDYWQMVFGPMLVLLVVFFKRGMFGSMPNSWRRKRAAAE